MFASDVREEVQPEAQDDIIESNQKEQQMTTPSSYTTTPSSYKPIHPHTHKPVANTDDSECLIQSNSIIV